MKKSTNKKSLFWRFYFVLGGMMCLLCWNSILNLTSFFINTINPKIYTNLGFGYCLGGLLSFILSPILFRSLKSKTTIYISLILNLLTFLSVIAICIINLKENFKVYLTTIIIIINGFFSTTFQSKIAAIAATVSHEEISLYCIGTGLVGALSNIFSYLISILYKENEDDKLNSLTYQTYIYIGIVICFFIIYFISEFLFEKFYGDTLDNPEEREMEIIFDESLMIHDTEKSMSEAKIVIRSFDVLFGLFFNYTIVLSIIGCFLIEAQLTFDQPLNNGKGDGFSIPVFIFFYNLFDTIGKYLPSSMFFKSTITLHLCCILGLVFWGYYIYILNFVNIPAFMVDPYFRCVVPSILGLLNGFYTNNFMVHAASRFKKKMEKGKTGYFSVLFLLCGITMGTFLNFIVKN